jgi:outer membrane protein TolC
MGRLSLFKMKTKSLPPLVGLWSWLILQMLSLVVGIPPLQGSEVKVLNGEELVAICMQDHPRLLAATQRKFSTAQHAQSQLSIFRPNVTVFGESGWRDSSLSYSNPLGQDQYLKSNIQCQQFLYGFGLRNSLKAATQSSVALSEIEMQEAKHLLAFEIRQAYSLVLLRQAQHKARQAATRWNALELDISEQALKAGSIRELDFRQSRQQYHVAVSSEKQSQYGLKQARLSLEGLVGKSDFELADDLGFQAIDPETFESSALAPATLKLESATSVQWLKALRQNYKAQATAYRRTNRPQLSAVVGADRSGENWGQGQNDWRAGLQLSWSLDTQQEAKYEASAQDSLVLAVDQDLKDLLSVRLQQWHSLNAQSQILLERMELQRDICADSELNYQSSLKSFQEGRDLITRVEEARLARVQAQLDLAQLKWSWDMMCHEMKRWRD